MPRVLEYLEIVPNGETEWYRCLKCAHELGATDVDYKELSGVFDEDIGLGQPPDRVPRSSRYVLRHFCCPACGVAFEVDMMLGEEEAIVSFELKY